MKRTFAVVAAALLWAVQPQLTSAQSKQKFDNDAGSAQMSIAQMLNCSRVFKIKEYRTAAIDVDEAFFRLLDAAGLELANVDLHYMKIKALMGGEFQGPPNDDDGRKYCDTMLHMAKFFVEDFNSKAATQNKKRLQRSKSDRRSTAARADAGRAECSLSADYYRERSGRTGSVADLSCYIKASGRELDAATQETLR